MRAKSGGIKSDLRKVDAHVVQSEEYDELPELTADQLKTARWKISGRKASLARAKKSLRGRPKLPQRREQIALRLPPRTLERWRASGPGWQTRMAEVLTKTAPDTKTERR